MNARITLTFIIEEFEEFVDDWMTETTDVQEAANLAMGDQLEEQGFGDFIDWGKDGSHIWTIEYPVQEATE